MAFDIDKEIALSRRICAAKEGHNAKRLLAEIEAQAHQHQRDTHNQYRRAMREIKRTATHSG